MGPLPARIPPDMVVILPAGFGRLWPRLRLVSRMPLLPFASPLFSVSKGVGWGGADPDVPLQLYLFLYRTWHVNELLV